MWTNEKYMSMKRRCEPQPGNEAHYAIPIAEVRELLEAYEQLLNAPSENARRRKEWEVAHPGQKFSDVHARWWVSKDPPKYDPETARQWSYDCVEAIVAAMLQEGQVAWHGDGTHIVMQMVMVQAQLRADAEKRVKELEQQLSDAKARIYALEDDAGLL